MKEITIYYPKVDDQGYKITKSFAEEWTRKELQDKYTKDTAIYVYWGIIILSIVALITKIFY